MDTANDKVRLFLHPFIMAALFKIHNIKDSFRKCFTKLGHPQKLVFARFDGKISQIVHYLPTSAKLNNLSVVSHDKI
jgi:hypothetical protein